MKGNHYRNPLKTPWMMRIIFASVTLAAIFAAFVVLRNRQIKQGDRIQEVEITIAEAQRQIEEQKRRLAGLLDRSDLKLRCRYVGSTLVPIRASQILVIEPEKEVQALPKVASSD